MSPRARPEEIKTDYFMSNVSAAQLREDSVTRELARKCTRRMVPSMYLLANQGLLQSTSDEMRKACATCSPKKSQINARNSKSSFNVPLS